MNLPNFYIHTVSFSQNNPINLLQLGRNVCSAGYSYPQYNNTYMIYFVKSGSGTLETRGKKYTLSANDAFIVPPNELSIQTADSDKPWELCFFAFSGDRTKKILDKTFFKNDIISVSLKDGAIADDIINAAVYLNNNSHSEFTALEYLFRFFSYFDASKPLVAINDFDDENRYVSEIKKYVQSNYLEPIKISDISDRLNVNRSHLYRIFKSETGMGVEDYIINVRMNHARVLLVDTELPVATVSTMVGYKNYTTFFKRFKQTTGLTPLEFRNQNTQ